MLLFDSTTGYRLISPAFIIPQWGGVIAFNQGHQHSPRNVAEIFSIFRSQLLTLLGVPSLPNGVRLAKKGAGEATESAPLSEWQINALLRRRTRENAEGAGQTLKSIVSLVEKLGNMPVGMDVRGDVLRALEELESVRRHLQRKDFVSFLFLFEHQVPGASTTAEQFAHSRLALSLSSRAFFNPGMLGQLYFPAEHTYAIYMLFAPASMPLIVTLIKEIRNWRRSKQKVE